MAIFKCKMCGATLKVPKDTYVLECEYCGTEQTVPKIETKEIEGLYERAYKYFSINDYDKALEIYNEILNENPRDPEAYWSLVLCEYGIEYVVDPRTKRRVATVNRAQYDSIYDNDNYKKALKYATDEQKDVYTNEAKYIDNIQRRILEISKKEKPYDVFICYKETNDRGGRTEDSVLAMDIYNELTREGLKVFFSRITLEDKLGSEYEPYIFAAINSAKVMICVGTSAKNFNSPWIKNEWSRFLRRTKNKKNKCIIIPAYKGISPYSIPSEINSVQAQDLAKVGSIQEIVHGVKKFINQDNVFNNNLTKNKRNVLLICFVVFIILVFIKVFFINKNAITGVPNIKISGEEYSSELTSISFHNINFSNEDLLELAKKSNLITLRFYGCELPNIKFIESLPNLKTLEFRDYTQIDDYSLNKNCDSITRFAIYNADIKTIEFISKFNNLTFIGVPKEFPVDLSPIANHSKLTQIDFTGSKNSKPLLSNFKWCKGLVSLKTLDTEYITVVSDTLKSLEGIDECKSLKKLSLHLYLGLKDIDFSPINKLSNLEEFYITLHNKDKNTEICDLSNLSNLKNLKILSIQSGYIDTNIIKLNGLSKLVNLEYLTLDRLIIIDNNLKELNNLLNLKKIDLSWVGCDTDGANTLSRHNFNLCGIENLANLETLNVHAKYGSAINNIDIIKKLKKLSNYSFDE